MNEITIDMDRENRMNFLLNARLPSFSKKRTARFNREVLKMTLHEPFPKCYPSNLSSDNAKFIYLKELLGKNEVSSEIFVDLVQVLNVSDGLREKEGEF
jgi:hypothetical protein